MQGGGLRFVNRRISRTWWGVSGSFDQMTDEMTRFRQYFAASQGGSCAPFLLRHDAQEGVYKFVGEAWISGLMTGEAYGL